MRLRVGLTKIFERYFSLYKSQTKEKLGRIVF